MSFNLLDSIKGLISDDIIGKIAVSLGESSNGVEKAISGAIPTVLTGLLHHASAEGGSQNILNMASDAHKSGIVNNTEGLIGSLTTSPIGNMASSLFGDKLSGITRMISGFSGINETSAASVLGMIAPVALGALGGHAAVNHLDSNGISNFLDSQKDSILQSVPQGLPLATTLGHHTLEDITGKFKNMISNMEGGIKSGSQKVVDTINETEKRTGGFSRYILPLILGLILIGLLYYFLKGCKGPSKVATSTDTVKAISTDTTKMNEKVDTITKPVSLKVKLPNGTELDAFKGGIEDRLVAFLGTDYKKLGADSLKKIWFDFDNLNFKTGSSELTPESQKQVDNIAAILKAFPTVKLKIGGYTDKTGSETENLKLSQSRAETVKADLEKSGIGKQITEASGYGSTFAKFLASASESLRVKDRHVSVSVRL